MHGLLSGYPLPSFPELVFHMQAPAPAPVPTGPPANLNLDNVDTSAVQEGLKPVVTSLTNLFRACAANAQAGAKKRESDDNSKRLAQLFYKLNAGETPFKPFSLLLPLYRTPSDFL